MNNSKKIEDRLRKQKKTFPIFFPDIEKSPVKKQTRKSVSIVPTNVKMLESLDPLKNSFYKNMFCSYLGAMGELIRYTENDYDETELKINLQRSFLGKTTSKNPYKNIDKLYQYKLLDIISVEWFDYSNSPFFILEKNKAECIFLFNTGDRSPFIHFDETLMASDEETIEIFKTNIVKVVNLVMEILKNGYKKILLCGHSAGMAASVFLSFVLLYISEPKMRKFCKTQNIRYDILDDINFGNIEILNNIKKKLYVCGSAGFPIIFKNEEQFYFYYKMLGGSYLHIALCEKNYIDEYVLSELDRLQYIFTDEEVDPSYKPMLINDYQNTDSKKITGYMVSLYDSNGNFIDLYNPVIPDYKFSGLKKYYPIRDLHEFDIYRNALNKYCLVNRSTRRVSLSDSTRKNDEQNLFSKKTINSSMSMKFL